MHEICHSLRKFWWLIRFSNHESLSRLAPWGCYCEMKSRFTEIEKPSFCESILLWFYVLLVGIYDFTCQNVRQQRYFFNIFLSNQQGHHNDLGFYHVLIRKESLYWCRFLLVYKPIPVCTLITPIMMALPTLIICRNEAKYMPLVHIIITFSK